MIGDSQRNYAMSIEWILYHEDTYRTFVEKGSVAKFVSALEDNDNTNDNTNDKTNDNTDDNIDDNTNCGIRHVTRPSSLKESDSGHYRRCPNEKRRFSRSDRLRSHDYSEIWKSLRRAPAFESVYLFWSSCSAFSNVRFLLLIGKMRSYLSVSISVLSSISPSVPS